MASEGHPAGRRGTLRHGVRVRVLAAAIAAIGAPAALANPSGAQVVQGTAALRQEGNRLTVTTSNGAVIHWDRFSIGAGDTTRFVQPDAASQVLNRVVGGSPSEILGRLESNGRVFLINPNGVAFGRGAQVDVGALVVSTLKLSNEDFAAGRLQFGGGAVDNQSAGAIRNEGAIRTARGGTVYLVAPRIENAGLIHTPEGQVLLAAGHRVSIVNPRSPEVAWEIAAPESAAVNLGEIVARQIGLHGQIVRNSGSLQASSAVVGEDGRIVLRAQRRIEQTPGGRMSASGVDAQGRARGGEIDIQAGEQVSLQGRVDAVATGVTITSTAGAPALAAPQSAVTPAGGSGMTPPAIASSPGTQDIGREGARPDASLERLAGWSSAAKGRGRHASDIAVADAMVPGEREAVAVGAGTITEDSPARFDSGLASGLAMGLLPADAGAPQRRPSSPVLEAATGPVEVPRQPTPSPPLPQPDPRHAIVGGPAGTGGRVRVLAREIVLGEGLVLDASGPAGGGSVLVGGELQGASAGGPNAVSVTVAASAYIAADATVAGQGGRIIVWADDSTQIHGAISARGGPQGGDGGFIETSGRRVLTVTRPADASAPQGRPGEWLLDPYNVFIRAGSGSPPPGGVFNPDSDDSVITTGAIETALGFGTSVTITTGTAGGQAGNITLEAPITASSVSFQRPTLTLRAASTGSIALNADIRSAGELSSGLNLVLEAGGDVTFGGSSPFSRSFELRQGRFDASQVLGTLRVGDGGISPVTINAASIDLRHVALRNSAQFVLNGATTIAGDLSISAGTLAGSGNVLVKGAFTAGTTPGQSQPGFIELAGGTNGETTFTTQGSSTIAWGEQDDALFRLGGHRRWINEGNLRILDAARIVLGGYQQPGHATLDNRASGTISLEGSNASPIQREDGFGGDTVVINQGLLKKLGEDVAEIELDVTPTPGSVFRNAQGGTVRVEQGSLRIDRGDSDAGDYTVMSGARLVFAGGDRSIGALTLSGGTVELEGSAPQLTVDGAFASSGTAMLKGAGGVVTRAASSVSGSLVIQGPTGPTITWENLGTLSGGGTIDLGANRLLNKGAIRPGTVGSAGTLTVKGTVVLDAAGELRLDIGGPLASDQFAVQGVVSIGGAVRTDRLEGYTPSDGQMVRAVTGATSVAGRFDSVQMGTGLTGFAPTYELGDPVRLVHAGSGMRLFTNAAGGRTWHVAGNWQGSQLPASTDAVLIDANDKLPIVHASTAGSTIIGQLTLTPGTPLSVEGGSLTVGGTTRLDGFLRVSGDASASLQGAVQGAQGSLELGSGRTVLLGGAATLGSVTLGSGSTLGGTGSLEVSSRFTRDAVASLGANFSAVTLRQADGDLSPGPLTVAGPIRLTTVDANGRLIIDRLVRSTAATGSITVSAAGDLQVAADADPAGLVAPTQSITVGRDLKLSAGSGSITPAQITATGGPSTMPATVAIDIDAAGRVELLAGPGGAPATIGIAGGSAANGTVRIAAAGGLSLGSGAQIGLGPGMTGTLGLTLSSTAGNIALDGPVRGGGQVRIVADRTADSTAGRVSLGSGARVVSAGTGDAIVIAAGQRFSNGAGSQALEAGAGRWLVYSRADPDYHDRGGLPFDFKHYGQTYSATSAYDGPGTGNGFLYAVSPVLTPSVTGIAVRAYDRTDLAPTAGFQANATGAIDGDTVVVKAVAATFPGRHVGQALSVDVTVAVDSASQSTAKVYGYGVSPAKVTVPGAGEIQPRLLTTGFTGVDKVYDGTTTATVVPEDDRLSGDMLTVGYDAAFDSRVVGILRPITVSGIRLSGADASNYALGSSTGQTTASITARELTLSGLSAQDKVYDGTTVATLTGTPQLQGAIAGDAVSADLGSVTGAFADRRVGTAKAVNFAGVALGGADAANYTLPATLASAAAITARSVAAVDLKAADRVYDGTTAATLTGGGLQGAVTGDAVTLDLSGAQASFADRRVGAGKTVSATGLTLSGADASNYALGSSTGQTTASITARELTLSGLSAQDKVYDGTTVATLTGTPQLQGSVAGDAVSLDLGDATVRFADRNVGAGKAVSVSGEALAGADAVNYRLAGPLSFSAAITAREVTIVGLGALDRVYDGSTRAILSGGNLQGPVPGDAVALDTSASDARFADKAVGMNKPVSVTGLRLGGADAGNYALGSANANLQATITARPLGASFTGIDKVYDGRASAQASVSDDRVPGDALTIDFSASFPDRHVGVARPIAISGITLGGADAGNYSTPLSASASATISVRPLATWSGPAVGDWLTAAHWDALPDRANVAAVSIPASVEVRYDGSVPVTLNSLTNVGTLLLSGAGLQAAQLDNRGRLLITAGASLDLGSQSVLGAGTLLNEGSLRLSGANVANRLENTGSLELSGANRINAITNTGRVTLPGGTTTLEGGYLQRSGSTQLGSAFDAGQTRLVAPEGVRIEGGRLAGQGTIVGSVLMAGGTLAPGASPGALSIDGSLSLGAGSRFAIELGGTASDRYDTVSATGALALGGTLEASSYQGFRPAPADTFDILRGASASGRFAEARTDDPLLLGFNFRSLRIVTPDGSLPLPADRVPLGPAEITQAQLGGLAAGRKDAAAALAESSAGRGSDAETGDAQADPLAGAVGALTGSSTTGSRGGSGSDDEQPVEPVVLRRSLVRSLELPESESLEELSRAATREVRHLRPSRSRSRGSGC